MNWWSEENRSHVFIMPWVHLDVPNLQTPNIPTGTYTDSILPQYITTQLVILKIMVKLAARVPRRLFVIIQTPWVWDEPLGSCARFIITLILLALVLRLFLCSFFVLLFAQWILLACICFRLLQSQACHRTILIYRDNQGSITMAFISACSRSRRCCLDRKQVDSTITAEVISYWKSGQALLCHWPHTYLHRWAPCSNLSQCLLTRQKLALRADSWHLHVMWGMADYHLWDWEHSCPYQNT